MSWVVVLSYVAEVVLVGIAIFLVGWMAGFIEGRK